VKEINEAMKRAASRSSRAFSATPPRRTSRSTSTTTRILATFHMDQTKVQNGTLVRVMSWYDNEWGFSQPHGGHRRGDGEADLTISSVLSAPLRAPQMAADHPSGSQRPMPPRTG
jgi:hypothetical protein